MSDFYWPLMQETITFSDRLKMAAFTMTTKKFTNGEKVRQFEQEWSDWLGCKHSLFVSSGSTANFLLVAAVMEKYNISAGDKVLLPACTWVTNVNPCIQLGMVPIFCDIELKNFSFEEDHLDILATQHSDIKLIFVTHLLGYGSDTSLLKKKFPNAVIIQDICESHGVEQTKGIKFGADDISVGSTFSFYFGHHMTSIEGGMVSINDPDLYDLMKTKRSHGLARELTHKSFQEAILKNPEIPSSFLFVTDGYNFRNHEIPAVLASSQLKRLDSMIERRRRNQAHFCEHFFASELGDHYYEPHTSSTNSSFCFPVVAKSKSVAYNLRDILSENRIEWRPVVSGNLLRQPYLKKYAADFSPVHNNIDLVHDNGVYVGNNHFVKNEDVELLVDLMIEATY